MMFTERMRGCLVVYMVVYRARSLLTSMIVSPTRCRLSVNVLAASGLGLWPCAPGCGVAASHVAAQQHEHGLWRRLVGWSVEKIGYCFIYLISLCYSSSGPMQLSPHSLIMPSPSAHPHADGGAV